MRQPTLLAVPNVSEGRDAGAIASIAQAFGSGAPAEPNGTREPGSAVRLLDVHSDVDHHRSVFTLAGQPGGLADALLEGARSVLEHVDLSARDADDQSSAGRHPHVGALDVVPLVYLRDEDRGAACAEALVTAERLGSELALPVFLYGVLTGSEALTPRTRAQLRRGGLRELSRRMAARERREPPDFGPGLPHATAGVALVAARPPLVAFNLQLAAPATPAIARAIAARIREGGERGIPGVRAIGVELAGEVSQVSMNVEDPVRTPLAGIVAAVRAQAEVESAELVGLAPRAALENFPDDLPMPGFDPARHVIENRLGSS